MDRQQGSSSRVLLLLQSPHYCPYSIQSKQLSFQLQLQLPSPLLLLHPLRSTSPTNTGSQPRPHSTSQLSVCKLSSSLFTTKKHKQQNTTLLEKTSPNPLGQLGLVSVASVWKDSRKVVGAPIPSFIHKKGLSVLVFFFFRFLFVSFPSSLGPCPRFLRLFSRPTIPSKPTPSATRRIVRLGPTTWGIVSTQRKSV